MGPLGFFIGLILPDTPCT